MTIELTQQPVHVDELTTAAAILLTQAIAIHRRTLTPLSSHSITLAHRYSISHTGPGTRFVSATEAWEELAARGLIAGTVDEWIPTLREVASNGHA